MHTCLIIDDDLPSTELLAEALGEIPEARLVGTAQTLAQAKPLIEKHRPDVIFLDMVFPDAPGQYADGSEWLAAMALPPETRVVFYTGYTRYIRDAFSLRAFDFLLKPLETADLRLIFQRLRLEPPQSRPLLPPARSQRALAITTVTNDKIILPPAEILYFRYDTVRKIWEVVLTSLKRYLLKRSTTASLLLEYGPAFFRTHKRFIINTDYLAMVTARNCILLPPFDNITEILISKNYRRPLFDRFYDI